MLNVLVKTRKTLFRFDSNSCFLDLISRCNGLDVDAFRAQVDQTQLYTLTRIRKYFIFVANSIRITEVCLGTDEWWVVPQRKTLKLVNRISTK